MALGNNNSVIYLSIADGRVVRRFKEPTASSTQRTSKTGKIVHEETYEYCDGMITDIFTRENEYGKFWAVIIEDKGVKYNLQFQYSGGNASSFLKTLPNADLTKKIKIVPKQQIDGEKKRSSIILVQDDKPLRWFWTKDNAGDLPGLQKIKIKGKEQWDDSDMMDYLENYLETVIKPKITNVEPIVNAQEDEDVPF